MKCFMCDHPADINGFCERCYDDLHNGGKSDAIKVVNRLLAINAKQAAELAEATTLLEQADKRIGEMQTQLFNIKFQHDAMADLQQYNSQRIAELEAAWCNQCNLPADHCRENHDGALYAEGCKP